MILTWQKGCSIPLLFTNSADHNFHEEYEVIVHSNEHPSMQADPPLDLAAFISLCTDVALIIRSCSAKSLFTI